VGKPGKRNHLKDKGVDGRMGSKWTLGKLARGGVERIHLAQDRDRWQALVNAVMNLLVLAPKSYLVSYNTPVNSLKIVQNFLRNKLIRLRRGYLEEQQCDFKKGRNCTGATFTIHQSGRKKEIEFNLPTVLLSTYYEKACDNLYHNIM
jgi:hypothetical protein